MSTASRRSIQDGRGQPNPYALWERVLRIVWLVVYRLAYRPVPRSFNLWHRSILRLFAAKVGRRCVIYPSAEVYFPWRLCIGDYSVIADRVKVYNLAKICIGEHTVISQHCHLCAGTHDYTKGHMPLLRFPITIGNEVWICTDAFIAPGVTVGDGAVVGARACVFKSVEPLTVVGGNPARFIKKRTGAGTTVVPEKGVDCCKPLQS